MQISRINTYNNSFNGVIKPILKPKLGQVKNNEGGILNRNTTYYFRNDIDWADFGDYLKEKYKNPSDIDFKIYGCSTGEEAYSLAMVLKEKFGTAPFKIDASDILRKIVMHNKMSRYSGVEFTGYDIKKACLSLKTDENAILKYLMHSSSGYLKLSRDITDTVNYRCANILSDFDKINKNKKTVIMCRNLWPYIDPNEYENFAQELYKSLAEDSIVVIGQYDYQGEFCYINSYRFPHVLSESGFKPVKRAIGDKEIMIYGQKPLIFEK